MVGAFDQVFVIITGVVNVSKKDLVPARFVVRALHYAVNMFPHSMPSQHPVFFAKSYSFIHAVLSCTVH